MKTKAVRLPPKDREQVIRRIVARRRSKQSRGHLDFVPVADAEDRAERILSGEDPRDALQQYAARTR